MKFLPLLIFVLLAQLKRDHYDMNTYIPKVELEQVTISASSTPEWLFPLVLNFTKKKEGFMRRPYLCPAGLLTVGYGDVITNSSEFHTWTEKEASDKLVKNFETTLTWVKRISPEKCKEHQLWAIAMLAMNCRMTKWKKSELRQKIIEYTYIPNRSAFTELRTKWEAWSKIRNPKTGKKYKSRVLVERRYLEYLIFTGQWNQIKTDFKQYFPTA